MTSMQPTREQGGSIRHKLGALFSPRGAPPPTRGKEDVDHNTFITSDVLRVRREGGREGGGVGRGEGREEGSYCVF